jgi:hypothetical protein
MSRTVRSAIILTTLATIATISIAANAKTTSAKWIDFGTTNGARLKLDANSIKSMRRPIDDSINLEGRDDAYKNSLPMHRVISFDYNVAGYKRSAYTTSCQGSNLKVNPSWRTYITIVDYWPQYFSVAANSAVRRNMLVRVCKMSATK